MPHIPTKHFPTFSERVVKAALSIPRGRVSTYGHLARAAGDRRNFHFTNYHSFTDR